MTFNLFYIKYPGWKPGCRTYHKAAQDRRV